MEEITEGKIVLRKATAEQVRIWNEQASADDTIYVIGDFCNYNSHENDFKSGLAVSKLVNAHIILIIGNSEERVLGYRSGYQLQLVGRG